MNRLIAAIAVFLCAPGTAFADDVAEASIRGNEFRAGGQVELDGRVNRSDFLGGGNVTVGGEVGRNLYVAGGTLRLGPGARISGQVSYRSGDDLVVEPGAQVSGGIKQVTSDRAWRRAAEGATIVGAFTQRAWAGLRNDPATA